jgi:2OG-Fe(II) oxygenase superfamily
MKKLAMAMTTLVRTLADVLAQNLDYACHDFPQNCNERTCFLRLNRYPPCPFSSPETGGAPGLVSHTDSDYLTILYQDQVGGLQVMKDSRWVSVRPNRNALIVNIGDLFQVPIFFLPSLFNRYIIFHFIGLVYIRFQLIFSILRPNVYVFIHQLQKRFSSKKKNKRLQTRIRSKFSKFAQLHSVVHYILILGHSCPEESKAKPSPKIAI